MALKATFWAQATPAVTYYRCKLPARHLPGKVVKLTNRDITVDGEGKLVVPRQEGAAIWSFPGNLARAKIMSLMQDQGTRVLVEVDDNYTTPPPFYEISTWIERVDRRDPRTLGKHSYEMHVAIAKDADGVIVSTPRLAEVYESINSNVYLCPNCVDPDDWPERPERHRDSKLHIGWAASDSHRYDAPLIRDALCWASTQPDVEVIIIGIKPEITRYKFRYWHMGWVDSLKAYRHNLGVLDVALCPLRPGKWEDCKSDVKAMEAAMAGALPIVSEVEPYRPWFDRTYTARNEWDWRRIVKHLVRNRDEIKTLAEKAREYVLAERTIQGNISKWRDAVEPRKPAERNSGVHALASM